MPTNTRKLYYEDPSLRYATARIVQAEENRIVTDQTIFFGEGGGQVGDIGTINAVPVRDTIKRGGRRILRQDLPDVNVETEVVHVIEGDAADLFHPGEEVELRVDNSFREGVTRHHTCTHIVMGAIWHLLGRDSYLVKGCRITPEQARLDVFIETHKFQGELLREIEEVTNAWIATDASVFTHPVTDVPEMYRWHCEWNLALGNYLDPEQVESYLSQPCGGTHVPHLRKCGVVSLRRRSEGKNTERLYIKSEFPEIAQEIAQGVEQGAGDVATTVANTVVNRVANTVVGVAGAVTK